VFVSDPELIGSALTSGRDRDVLRAGEPNADALAPIVGVRSVLTSAGARHLRQRKLLLPRRSRGTWDAVIKETHRLRPTVPNVVRRVREPFDLGAWRLPVGSVISPAVYLVHRRADLYAEPHAFRPERFLDEQTPSYAWLPFGGGVRRCIRASSATLEMQEVLRAVFSRLELRPARPGRPERPKRRTVTSVPATGTVVVAAPRLP